MFAGGRKRKRELCVDVTIKVQKLAPSLAVLLSAGLQPVRELLSAVSQRPVNPDLWTLQRGNFCGFSSVSSGSETRHEAETPAGVQLHPARQRVPGPLSGAHRALLRTVSSMHPFTGTEGVRFSRANSLQK